MKSNDLEFWSFCFSLLWRGYKKPVYTAGIYMVYNPCCGGAVLLVNSWTLGWGGRTWWRHHLKSLTTAFCRVYICVSSHFDVWPTPSWPITDEHARNQGATVGREGRGEEGGRWWQELGWGRLVSELWLPIGWSVVVCSTYDWSQNNNDVQISASAAVFVLSHLSPHL